MTASSFWSSTRSWRRVLCALDEPKSTPSGTMTAARPPFLRRRRNRARKRSSVFLVLTICWRSLAHVSKTDSGGTDHVWFYDVDADGWSLDDKRTPLLPEEKLGPVPKSK